MKYLVILIIIMMAGLSANFIYYKTSVCKFIIDKLKINTKAKCTLIDFIVFAFGMTLLTNTSIDYKNIFLDICIYMVVLIAGLSEYIRSELKYYKRTQ